MNPKPFATLDLQFFGIVVYVWWRGEVCQYVGMSSRGIMRLASHHVFNPASVQNDDRLTLWKGFKSINEAAAFEKSLIRDLKPRLNLAIPQDEKVRPDYQPESTELPMKPLLNDFEGFDRVERSKTIPGLVAWPTSDSSCRIQCSDRITAKRLAKLPDCTRVGYSVKGAWIQIYALPYTIDWVSKKVIHKWTPDFPRKNEGSKTDIAPPDAISAGETPTATL